MSLFAVQDIEVNDGSESKPYYMNRSLMNILGKKNAQSVEKARRERQKQSSCCGCC